MVSQSISLGGLEVFSTPTNETALFEIELKQRAEGNQKNRKISQ